MAFNTNDIFRKLNDSGFVRLVVGGETYLIKRVNDGKTLRLTTLVYCNDDDFLPQSVRSAVFEAYLLGELEPGTYLKIDEDDYSVKYNFQSDFSKMSQHDFTIVLGDFIYWADEWRSRLEGMGKKDLVRVRSR